VSSGSFPREVTFTGGFGAGLPKRLPLKSFAKTRVTLTDLACAAGMTESALRYRVRRGQLSAPDRDGLFDRRRALAELARRPKQRGGRKRASIKAVRAPTTIADVADHRFRLVRARLEEITARVRDRREETSSRRQREPENDAFHTNGFMNPTIPADGARSSEPFSPSRLSHRGASCRSTRRPRRLVRAPPVPSPGAGAGPRPTARTPAASG
jgi:hypothetical protein